MDIYYETVVEPLGEETAENIRHMVNTVVRTEMMKSPEFYHMDSVDADITPDNYVMISVRFQEGVSKEQARILKANMLNSLESNGVLYNHIDSIIYDLDESGCSEEEDEWFDKYY